MNTQMGNHIGSTYDIATLRAYRHRLPSDVARKALKPRKSRFSLR
ncbi:hypothetical protein [Ornithinimicrobium ciconiae]|nr:hypothetical protein [Ornithinimicrobium ciconiae]